jgi:hypothetical protein
MKWSYDICTFYMSHWNCRLSYWMEHISFPQKFRLFPSFKSHSYLCLMFGNVHASFSLARKCSMFSTLKWKPEVDLILWLIVQTQRIAMSVCSCLTMPGSSQCCEAINCSNASQTLMANVCIFWYFMQFRLLFSISVSFQGLQELIGVIVVVQQRQFSMLWGSSYSNASRTLG